MKKKFWHSREEPTHHMSQKTKSNLFYSQPPNRTHLAEHNNHPKPGNTSTTAVFTQQSEHPLPSSNPNHFQSSTQTTKQRESKQRTGNSSKNKKKKKTNSFNQKEPSPPYTSLDDGRTPAEEPDSTTRPSSAVL